MNIHLLSALPDCVEGDTEQQSCQKEYLTGPGFGSTFLLPFAPRVEAKGTGMQKISTKECIRI